MKTYRILGAVLFAAAIVLGTSCHKHEPRERKGETEGTMIKESSWSITYKGRIDRKEAFHIECPGADYYDLLIVSQEELSSAYANDRRNFFLKEAEYLRQDAYNNNVQVTSYLQFATSNDIQFGKWLPHGSYYAFLVGYTDKGYLTGSYTELGFLIQEETADPDYAAWLGNWTSADGKVAIGVSAIENNYTYKIDGWEVGPTYDEQMNEDGDWFEAAWDPADKKLYIWSQFIYSYGSDAEGWNDILLLGNYVGSNNQILADEDENKDIAVMAFKDAEKNLCTLSGVEDFVSMQYFRWEQNNHQYYAFNTINKIPSFPIELIKSVPVQSPARGLADPTVKKAGDRPVTTRSIHRKYSSLKR